MKPSLLLLLTLSWWFQQSNNKVLNWSITHQQPPINKHPSNCIATPEHNGGMVCTSKSRSRVVLKKCKKSSFPRLCKQIQTMHLKWQIGVVNLETLNLGCHGNRYVRCHFSVPRVHCGSLSSILPVPVSLPCGRRYQIRGIPAKPASSHRQALTSLITGGFCVSRVFLAHGTVISCSARLSLIEDVWAFSRSPMLILVSPLSFQERLFGLKLRSFDMSVT